MWTNLKRYAYISGNRTMGTVVPVWWDTDLWDLYDRADVDAELTRLRAIEEAAKEYVLARRRSRAAWEKWKKSKTQQDADESDRAIEMREKAQEKLDSIIPVEK